MLPLQQAYEVRSSIMEYLKATYRFKEEKVHEAFYRFLEDVNDGLFKGPYVSLKTPFITATQEERAAIDMDIVPSFAPHKHQLEAFRRLHCHHGHQPEPTLLTTGTGSGKTECFLYPILDYCYQQNRNGVRPGVKVIIMYPMNALATDQAKRLAETIWNDPRLNGTVTAGLYIGEGQNASEYPTVMGPDHIIENRNAILDSQPDIILTNFKMLDFSLMKQSHQRIWKGNLDGNHMLRFLVLDELHTYDGAQGTDVANLIRRLKLKLGMQQGELCPVGTSATIGSKDDSMERLCQYASDVFGEEFTSESIIVENRQPVDAIFCDTLKHQLPGEIDIRRCEMQPDENIEAYIARLKNIWMPWSGSSPVEIGQSLRKMAIVRDLVEITSEGVISMPELQLRLEDKNPEYRSLCRRDNRNGRIIIESLLALIAMAKLDDKGFLPFLFLQVQLWMRELSGILRYVTKEPRFTWRSEINPNDEEVALPMYFCRECGASGWISMRTATDVKYSSDIRAINRAYMDDSNDIVFLNTEDRRHHPIEEHTAGTHIFVKRKDLSDAKETDSSIIELCALKKMITKDGRPPRIEKNCPECDSDQMAFVGQKASTLSSVALSQLFATDFEKTAVKNRKMLSFTNSVQDAAHQAGFYEGHTFRFLMRQSIQHYLKSQNHPVSVAELQKGFKEYWKKHLGGEEYYFRLIPEDLDTRLDIKLDYRTAGGEFKEKFKEEFDLRLDWEICSEFGLTAQLGRTLEKTGASASYFPQEKVEEVYEAMVPWLESNNMKYVIEQKTNFLHFVNGILHRVRMRGAVDHPFLEAFRTGRMTSWEQNNPFGHFLNKKFGKKIRRPKMIVTTPMRSHDDLVESTFTKSEKNPGWYYLYFHASLVDGIIDGATYLEAINDFYAQLFEVFVTVGLANKLPGGGGNYGLRPEAIMVEAKVKHIKCDHCQSLLCVAQSDTLSRDTHCLNFKCDGIYSSLENNDMNYYQKVYNRQTAPRIYAHEHTGLLDRELREAIEADFKNRPVFNSINTLVATSTLEMGIDIGSLNTVMNAAIPPKPSNFLQRVGRAGRKEGSALIVNVAHSGGAHDMYYYALPKEMMEGDVTPPGCFLEARDILRRHFLAYCIDTWVAASVNNSVVKKMEEIVRTPGILSEESFFVNELDSFVKANKMELWNNFVLHYPSKASVAMMRLQDYVMQGTMMQNLLAAFSKRISQYKHLESDKNSVNAYRAKLAKTDPRYDDATERLHSMKQQLEKMENEEVFEFLTNVGLLPNYAFPETGVNLSASIYSRPADREQLEEDKRLGKKPRVQEIEINRPACTAIRELAPGNYFYTQKHRLAITGVNTDWDDTLKRMRYCSECDAIAEAGTEEYKRHTCPKCNASDWGSNTHQYLRFTEAHCVTTREESHINAVKDERDSEKYRIIRHYRFDEDPNRRAFGLPQLGFGIEFYKNVTITEVNYGESKQNANPIDVAGNKVSEVGFVVCRHCGQATPLRTAAEADAVKLHDRFCRFKDVPYPADPDHKDVFESLFLYHEMQTEAIKILLPIQLMETDASHQLFKAGIELGLKKYYQSSPEHIRIDTYREKNPLKDDYDQYLVMYDTIPGGTGYLSKLFDKVEFGRLMQRAYEHLESCTCQNEGKDGCYHCILTYGNQYNRSSLSREAAADLFKDIVEKVTLWEEIPGGLDPLAKTGVVESSELERWFVELMRKEAQKHEGWSWVTRYDMDEKPYYDLTIKTADAELEYTVRRQYTLGPSLGVKNLTIPDFLFECRKAVIDGKEITDIANEIPQWAVYTDGYAYHATEECHRFYTDLKKREAIRNREQNEEHGDYRICTWTLGWSDLKMFQKKDSEDATADDLFSPSGIISTAEPFRSCPINRLHSNLERFFYVLTHPLMDDLIVAIKNHLACWTVSVDAATMKGSTTFLKKTSLVGGKLELQFAADGSFKPVFDWQITEGIENLDKSDWEDFWRRYNLLQFFEPGEIASDSQAPIFQQHLTQVQIDAIKQYYDEAYLDLVQVACEKGQDVPDGGNFVLEDNDGGPLAEAGFGLSELKMVVDPYSEDDEANFVKANYRLLTIDEAYEEITNL